VNYSPLPPEQDLPALPPAALPAASKSTGDALIEIWRSACLLGLMWVIVTFLGPILLALLAVAIFGFGDK
jgi:hypothetical protein